MAECAQPSVSVMSNEVHEILNDKKLFFKIMSHFIANDCEDTGVTSISFLLCQIDQVAQFFHSVGHENILHVFNAICAQSNFRFSYCRAWKICALSGIPGRRTLCINDSTFVNLKYEKWVKCVWLTTHVLALERSRRYERYMVKKIKECDSEIYRKALQYVFESFLTMYQTIQHQGHHEAKNNNAIETPRGTQPRK